MAIDVARVHFPARRAVAWLAERHAVPSPVCCLEESVGREGEKWFFEFSAGRVRGSSQSPRHSPESAVTLDRKALTEQRRKDDKARLCP